jgi:hypothetical protein
MHVGGSARREQLERQRGVRPAPCTDATHRSLLHALGEGWRAEGGGNRHYELLVRPAASSTLCAPPIAVLLPMLAISEQA